MARLEDLRDLRDGLVDRLAGCNSDQNYAVLGKLLTDVIRQIDEIDPEQVKRKETPLDEFSRRLLERRRAAAADQDHSAAN